MANTRPSTLLWIVLGVAGVLAGVEIWKSAIRPNLFPKNFGVVVEGRVYRSGELSPESMRRVVAEHGIRTVLDLGAYDAGSAAEVRMTRVCDALGVARFQMRLEGDGTGNPNYYVQALRLMTDPERLPILVHCGAGSERTSCAVILYRHFVEARAVEDVYPESYRHRHSDERNPKLRLVLDEWADKIGAAFRRGGQIPGVEPLPEPVAVGPSALSR